MGNESELRSDNNESHKRKIEGAFEIAKQKAQEIAARLNSEAEVKRPRFETPSSEPLFYSNSTSRSPLSDGVQQFQPTSNTQSGAYPYSTQPYQSYGMQGPSKKISIPNGKVGVIIGKGGETIKSLQLQSGAKIQITKDTEADPYSLTRDVEISGTPEQISRAEQLVNDAIAEAENGGSSQSANRLHSVQPGAEQIEMKVPNEKVALLIGKGGETIKTIQSRSGARMQIIPLRLPPGDTSTERSVFISGLTDQIESAKSMVNEIIVENRLRNPPVPSGYEQPAYTTPGAWAPPADPSSQQAAYGGVYMQGAYPTPSPYYANYSTQQQAGWDQSNSTTMAPPPQQSSGGYNNYSTPQDQSGYNYSQSPPSYTNQGYGQQPPSYGSQAITSQADPYGYNNQQMTPSQGGGYGGPPPGSAQSGGYGVQGPTSGGAAPPVYGQSGGYASPPAPVSSNYSQGTYPPPVYGQSQPSGHGAESNGDEKY